MGRRHGERFRVCAVVIVRNLNLRSAKIFVVRIAASIAAMVGYGNDYDNDYGGSS